MNIVPVHRAPYGLAVYNPNQGLNGIFGRIKEYVNKNKGKWAAAAIRTLGGIAATAAQAIPLVGGIVGEFIKTQTNQIANNVEASLSPSALKEADVTASEKAILDSFFNNTFNPFIAATMAQVAAAAKLQDKTAALAALNAIEQRITAIMEHYQVATQSGLSAYAIQQRNAVIANGLIAIHDAIATVVGNLGIQTVVTQVSFSASKYSYNPLFTTPAVSNITSDNYMAKTVTTLPETIQTVQPQVKDSPVPAAPAPEKKDNALLYGALAVGGILLASKLLGGKKKGRTASKPVGKRKSK